MTTEWLSALTALVAVIISPIISIYVVRKQFRASVISPNRQKWINEFRNQISELLTLIKFINFGHQGKLKDQDEFIDKYEKVHLIETKIKLMINPIEDDHLKLLKTIRSAIEEIFRNEEERDSHKLVELRAYIVSQSQAILKREWERVKKGK